MANKVACSSQAKDGTTMLASGLAANVVARAMTAEGTPDFTLTAWAGQSAAQARDLSAVVVAVTNTTLGLYGQQQFGWNDPLFVTGAVRVDNNSPFEEDIGLALVPKVSASRVVSEEPFRPSGLTRPHRSLV